MSTKDILLELRTKHGLSQDSLAEKVFVDGLCFGVIANMDFILICSYEAEGANPELILYKKR